MGEWTATERVWDGKKEGADKPYFQGQQYNHITESWVNVTDEYPTRELAEWAMNPASRINPPDEKAAGK